MIQTENITIGSKIFIRTYSDAGYLIHGGNPEGDYTEAIDPVDSARTYTETSTPIDEEETDAQEILDIILGGES